MSLQDWHKFGWLKPHETSLQELGNLLAIADLREEVVGRLRVKYPNLGVPVEDPPEESDH